MAIDGPRMASHRAGGRAARFQRALRRESVLPVALLFLGVAAGGCDASKGDSGRGRTPENGSTKAIPVQDPAPDLSHVPEVPPHQTKRRVLLIGWDGGTYRMIDPMIARGQMEHVQALFKRGVRADLHSTVIPISSEAWSAVATGKGPGKTGIVGFYHYVPNTYDVELINAQSRRGVPIWRLLNVHGLRTIIWGVPVTYPIEQVDGVMVAGMLAPEDSEYAWPPQMRDALKSRGFLPDIGRWREQRSFDIKELHRQLDLKTEYLLKMVADRNWSLLMVNFKSLDVLSHNRYTGNPSDVVGDVYQKLDVILGQLVEAAGDDTDIILMSDHGFFTFRKYFSVNAWLAKLGYQTRLDPNEGQGDDDFGNDEETGAAENAAARQPIEQFRKFRHSDEIARIDMSKTQAYAGVVECYFGTIRLNLKGREPRGVVDPADADALLARIESDLLAVKLPGRFTPVVERVWRTRDLYPGPYQDELPELMFQLDRRYLVKPDFRMPLIDVIKQVASHDHVGIFAAVGPSFKPGRAEEPVSVLDIAPTVLHILGLPVSDEMDGKVMLDLMADPAQVRFVSEQDDPAYRRAIPRWVGEMTDQQRDEVKNRLRDLDYFQ